MLCKGDDPIDYLEHNIHNSNMHACLLGKYPINYLKEWNIN